MSGIVVSVGRSGGFASLRSNCRRPCAVGDDDKRGGNDSATVSAQWRQHSAGTPAVHPAVPTRRRPQSRGRRPVCRRRNATTQCRGDTVPPRVDRRRRSVCGWSHVPASVYLRPSTRQPMFLNPTPRAAWTPTADRQLHLLPQRHNATSELSVGWVNPWVGFGWVGSNTTEVVKFWQDYVVAFGARLDKFSLHQAVKFVSCIGLDRVWLGPNFSTCNGLGQSADGLGWIASHKTDPWTTRFYRASNSMQNRDRVADVLHSQDLGLVLEKMRRQSLQ